MSARVDIMGTQLPLEYEFPLALTVRNVKEALQSDYGVPADRLTLRFYHGGALMHDGDTLASYDHVVAQQNDVVHLLLSVAPGPTADAPVRVFLLSEEFPEWRAMVVCGESSTMADLKRLAAHQLRWAEADGMELYNANKWTRLDRDENMGRLLREFLVVDGSVVWVQFITKVPQNGTLAQP
ncbi:unnamed protein product [Linum trigynum]|uniref:Ubiquitin-like domain-containing protein n=1 Tax=Linum trigynum TaxID=586398 RepID=A0AAV2EU62_9ROSI